MITQQKLDELDAIFIATQEEPDWHNEKVYYQELDALRAAVPELTAEIRRCWAELARGNQTGMVDLLRESREARCTSQ